MTYTIFPLRLVRGRPCTLWGTPVISLTTAAGDPAPVRYGGPWLKDYPVRPVEVTRVRPQWFPVAVYRCDVGRTRSTSQMTVRLPGRAGTITSDARIGFCGPRDPQTVVGVAAVGSWVVRGPAPPRRVAISVHSAVLTGGLPTWGRADLDGDGRRDLVVVRPSGTVSIHTRTGVQRIHVRPSWTLRLQGFTDLTGDGRTDILLGSTTLGCSAGYRLCSSLSTVLTLVGSSIRMVRFPGDQPQWQEGHGDVWEGWVCRPGGPVEVKLDLTSPTSYRLVRTRYRMVGLTAVAVSTSRSHGTSSFTGFVQLTRTRCPGLDATGWAPEQPR